jgi:hypothetical protein
MQTQILPEISSSELKAAREFLTSLREEGRGARAPRHPHDPQGGVTLRHGITRARLRSKTQDEG